MDMIMNRLNFTVSAYIKLVFACINCNSIVGSVYYDQARKVKSYLSARYAAPITTSAKSQLMGKAGILYVQYSGQNDGKIGLWNGKEVWGSADFTAQGQEFSLWHTSLGIKAV